jgi:hypothetical protein
LIIVVPASETKYSVTSNKMVILKRAGKFLLSKNIMGYDGKEFAKK